MMPCQHHPERVGSVVLDWDDDDQKAGVACLCDACIVPELDRLTALLGETTIHIRLAGPNPHPVRRSDDTVICAGCGHLLSAMDDTLATDAPGDPSGLTVWHVDCPMPAGLTMTPDGPVWR